MELNEFKDFAASMIEYVGNYLENIRDRKVLSSVKPGYLRPLLPTEAPNEPENWKDVMADIEKLIMPGVTHWHSPRFHAYFPTANSYPAMVADILSDSIACIGFSWISSPACTELEVVMMDWLAKMIGLPEFFLASAGQGGGGVIQGTASEATLVALLGAKAKALQTIKASNPELTDAEIVPKLVAYSSQLSHSSVERAGLLGGVLLRALDTDSEHKLRGDTLKDAITEDRGKGLIPFFVVATLGTTSCCSFDRLDEIAEVGNEEKIWVHVDAAYAGSAFVCPEYRHYMKGIELVESYNFNPHKWLQVTFDCSAMWLRNPNHVINAFNVDPLYLKHEQEGQMPDYRHWQIPLGRRFRSLKMWFVFRLLGVTNLQQSIRKDIGLAHDFARRVEADPDFELFNEVTMGLVCFRIKGSNELNETLLKEINDRGKVYMVPSKVKGTFFLRMAVCSRYTQLDDIDVTWNEVKEAGKTVMSKQNK
ncbi:aromatic-L-amino-acid decarboxylase-like [Adelges cooleyi]|uniref:aromatic-L-amino-acid decarboxylase-like n=1 Tax=Adelges cooleyi TaxID=133065 RepID=UPI00218059AA|nr:aromatic-L-amino-acid decarboxylase-like [Adelges cooleyi]XP_050439370.1 aromatic-L-amino-acid decarboxylase-like [Adelges cooleyi]XP_050439371.1 aromatic-L-amino-acid decarboxylase-like [Adelges cooleyi]